MDSVQKELILYGLKDHQCIIDQVIQDLNIEMYAFEIRLILVEAVMNAYSHGNRSDCNKPIYIRYLLIDNNLYLEIEDCGEGVGKENMIIPEEIDNDNLLSESGRGLFLIGCFADSVEMIRNTIHINKILQPV